MLRDNDRTYGQAFRDRIESLGIDEVKTAPRSPWQNPYCARLIGSIRLVGPRDRAGERHLTRILSSYFDYYHILRTRHVADGFIRRDRDVMVAGLRVGKTSPEHGWKAGPLPSLVKDEHAQQRKGCGNQESTCEENPDNQG